MAAGHCVARHGTYLAPRTDHCFRQFNHHEKPAVLELQRSKFEAAGAAEHVVARLVLQVQYVRHGDAVPAEDSDDVLDQDVRLA